jgi:hypothetical protein
MSSGVEFEEDKFSFNKTTPTASTPGVPNMGYGRPQIPSNTPKMAQWLMKHGIKSSHAAQVVLVVIVIINIIISFIVVNMFVL